MMKAYQHFKTISYHKWLVMKGCFAVGLYKQGVCHDLSKYMPSEFLVGAKYYQGDRSPNNAEREAMGYGCIIRVGINTIMNIGLITVCVMFREEWRRHQCLSNI